MTIFSLLCFGLVVHIIFLLSIFDIYFQSPIISTILPERNDILPPGKRAVLVSVDGLRLDSLFDVDPVSGKYVAEFMQNIIKYRGSWGVSQSHVPTESRPGHVAMLAGFYEDPSAVTRGWKENPVDFDSIFNRSHCFFAWGSPDILNIFFKGLKHDCGFIESYQNEQNFAGDTKKYDNWVYEKLNQFMNFSQKSKSVLYEEGIFFFLHLLGQDTSGHTDKPHSKKYMENLKNVDELLQKIENLFSDFYGDDKTSYIFTSDHGMTDWGSHGAGDPEEINTPIVAWGAGIKTPTNPSMQININQADITPLLAILLGASIPVNSIGKLPIAFLNMSRKQIAEATQLNAKQMVAQYVKAALNTKQQTISWFYKPFNKLSIADTKSNFHSISDAINSGKYSMAIKESNIIIEKSLEGLEYYQNYYQRTLKLSISLSYLGWITYLILVLFDSEYPSYVYSSSALNTVVCCSVLITLLMIAIQKLPFSFYCYMLLPQILWYLVIRKAHVLLPAMSLIKKTKCIFVFFSILLAVEMLVLSFFKRLFLCLPIGIILFWSMTFVRFKSKKFFKLLWLISGVALGLFSLLPTIGKQPNPTIILSSGIALFIVSFMALLNGNHGSKCFFLIQFATLALSVWNSYSVHYYFNENQTLLNLNQYISWILLILSSCFLFASSGNIFQRLIQVFMSLSVPFILLSIAHEVFFITCLFTHLFCWIFVEKSIKNDHSRFSNFRIAYFFLVYIFLAFFGLGNISSLNSFDPAWVRCFITVFSPFLMSSLILFKTFIPFLVVSCVLRTITVVLNITPERLFIIVLIYCNIMGLNFLFFIKNKGSWLDIGISISHYVIQQVTIVFLVLLYGIAKYLTFSKHIHIIENVRANKTSKAIGEMNSLPIFYDSLKMHKF